MMNCHLLSYAVSIHLRSCVRCWHVLTAIGLITATHLLAGRQPVLCYMLQQRLHAAHSTLWRRTHSCKRCIVKEACAHDQPWHLPLLCLLGRFTLLRLLLVACRLLLLLLRLRCALLLLLLSGTDCSACCPLLLLLLLLRALTTASLPCRDTKVSACE